MRLSLVTLLVRDYDEAIAFYGAMPGFRTIVDKRLAEADARGRPKRWVVVGLERGPGLLLARADTDEQEARIGDQAGGRVALFLETDDFARDAEALQRLGARFEEAPRNEAYGRVAVWRDPFGNRWDLIEPASG